MHHPAGRGSLSLEATHHDVGAKIRQCRRPACIASARAVGSTGTCGQCRCAYTKEMPSLSLQEFHWAVSLRVPVLLHHCCAARLIQPVTGNHGAGSWESHRIEGVRRNAYRVARERALPGHLSRRETAVRKSKLRDGQQSASKPLEAHRADNSPQYSPA